MPVASIQAGRLPEKNNFFIQPEIAPRQASPALDRYAIAGSRLPLPGVPYASPEKKPMEKSEFIVKSPPASVDASWMDNLTRSFSDAASVDSFLNEAPGIRDNIRVGGKTIGTLLFENPQRVLSLRNLQPVVDYLKRDNQTEKFLSGSEGSEKFLALNKRGHQELDYWMRLNFVLQKLGETGNSQNSEARQLIQGRINELQEILYQSYLNVAGALSPADRDQLDQTLFQGSSAFDRSQATARSLSNPPPAPAPQEPTPPAPSGRQAGDEERPADSEARGRVRMGAEVRAERIGGGGKVDMEAGKKYEMPPRNTFAPRILGVRGTVGPAFGTLLRLVPPALGEQISAGAKDTHNAAREVSLRNGGGNEGKGVQGSLAMEWHPLAKYLGYPFSTPFGWGAFAAGYAGHYVNEQIQTDQHVAFLEMQLGLGLSLGELATSNDYFDLNFHVGLFRLGYAFNNRIEGYYPFGPTQIGLCASVFKWSLCVDHQRWDETDSVEGGKETNRLDLTTLLLGSYF